MDGATGACLGAGIGRQVLGCLNTPAEAQLVRCTLWDVQDKDLKSTLNVGREDIHGHGAPQRPTTPNAGRT